MVKQDLNTSFGKKEQQYFDTDCLELNNTIIENINYCPKANIDNDMLDEKRRNYMYLYNLIKDFRKYAFEIIRKDVYFEIFSSYILIM